MKNNIFTLGVVFFFSHRLHWLLEERARRGTRGPWPRMSYHRPPPLTGLPRCAGLTRLDSLRGERLRELFILPDEPLCFLGVLQRGAVGHRTPIKFIHVNDGKS